MLRRAGILTGDEYLNGMSNQIEQVQPIPGRLVTPVNMASFDTWIKRYRPDENTANMSINYYPKGAVIGFLLDAKIRKATSGARSLDTGMQFAMQRYSGDKGYTTEQFYTVMSEAAGTISRVGSRRRRSRPTNSITPRRSITTASGSVRST